MTSSGPKLDDNLISTIQTLEKKIIQGFQNESETLTKFYAAEDQLDNLKQSLVKGLGKVDEATQAFMTNLKIRKQQFEEELQRATDDRERLLRDIEQLPKNQFAFQYCQSLYDKEYTKIVNSC